MASKVMPLEGFEFGKYTFEHEGKTWACLKGNKGEGQYNFKGDDFILKTTVFTGLVSGDDFWLVAVLASGSVGTSFDIQLRKQVDGKWTVQKEEGEAQAKKWQTDGCLTLVHCNDIPVLKTLVKVLHELKIILKPGNGEICVRYNLTDEKCPEIESALSLFLAKALTGEIPASGTPEYDAAVVVANVGLMAMPVLHENDLPCKLLYDLFGKLVGQQVECFEFTGVLPCYEALKIVPPKASERKAKGSWGGGATVNTTVTAFLTPQDRAKYICESLRAMDFDCVGDDAAAINTAMNKALLNKQVTFMQAFRLAFQMTTDKWMLD